MPTGCSAFNRSTTFSKPLASCDLMASDSRWKTVFGRVDIERGVGKVGVCTFTQEDDRGVDSPQFLLDERPDVGRNHAVVSGRIFDRVESEHIDFKLLHPPFEHSEHVISDMSSVLVVWLPNVFERKRYCDTTEVRFVVIRMDVEVK